ncbi:MAG: hypothetical protein L0Z53_11285 [Acidobacteriales bacterium]|nr:hypothetical protein [Terriglobales bacterium]
MPRKKPSALEEFTPAELRKLRSLRSPAGIQRFLDDMPYHLAGTAWSPRKVLAEETAHCLEGAIFAAAALRAIGFPPLLMDMEAHRDTDHVLAIFSIGKCWGALAKSNYSGCRYREPVYRSLRELAMSYFEGYFNLARERSLRTFSRPVNLARFDAQHWMTTEKNVWFIADYLCDIPHTPMISRTQANRLVRLDSRSFDAGMVGYKRK